MKKTNAMIVLGCTMFVSASLITYGIGYAMKLPLPLVDDGIYHPNYDNQKMLLEKWNNVKVYKTKEMVKKEEVKIESTEASKKEEVKIDVANSGDFFKKFSEIQPETLTKYVENDKALILNGYEKMILDKADLENTPTGIKTTKGDDVLAIDAKDNILLIGLNVSGNKGKLAIIKNSKQLGMSVADDLTYWEKIDSHAKKESALLAINASGYTWNKTGNYGTLYGVAKRNGEIIRRVKDTNKIVGFTKDGKMQIGGDLNNMYNACEYSPVLVKDSKAVYTGNEGTRIARTAIGQTANGDILLLVVDGDDTSKGATLQEVTAIMQKYGAVNASNLSDGSCSIMWWNGRVINKAFGGNGTGVKLPNAWVVRHP